MTNPSKQYRNRGIITEHELEEMLKKTDEITNKYFRLRVRALIALVKKFGKRRIEQTLLKRSDLKIQHGYLYVKFTIRKKHKRGLFQYFQFLKKTNPEALNKPLPELQAEWKTWQTTEEGYHVKEEKREKRISTQDRYIKFVLEYLDYLRENHNEVKYVFPSGHSVFGTAYIFYPDKALSGRQLLRLVKPLNPKVWLHLLRETKGAEVARDRGNTLESVYAVRDTLDLENEETAYRYVRRYAVQEIKAER